MEEEFARYYGTLAAAYFRGKAARTGVPAFENEELLHKGLSELGGQEIEEILACGQRAGEKLYAFKNTHGDMPRIKRVLGFLKSVQFDSLLDVGSGRGVFLFPFLEEFPRVQVASVDILPRRVEFLQDMSRGGIGRLKALEGDICTCPLPERAADVVTLLEVLEHIPDVGAAVKAAVGMARKYVVVTVPSKPDNNPEHIHLLTKPLLTELFMAAGCRSLHFDGVSGHLFMAAVL